MSSECSNSEGMKIYYLSCNKHSNRSIRTKHVRLIKWYTLYGLK